MKTAPTMAWASQVLGSEATDLRQVHVDDTDETDRQQHEEDDADDAGEHAVDDPASDGDGRTGRLVAHLADDTDDGVSRLGRPVGPGVPGAGRTSART